VNPAARRPREGSDERPLSAGFYDRPVVAVAQDLIGTILAVGDCAGVIVETEAYHHSEPACHAYVGLTARTSTLFGEPGTAYVYRSYGIHALINAVCEPPEVGAAVLIRALEPIAGLEAMARRRGPRGDRVRQLCSGPGKLTQALGIGLGDNASDLSVGPVLIRPRPNAAPAPAISATTRIGITKGVELPWRFCLTGSTFLSVPVPRPG
jgi:DNA-3-methyladenine glycosylase